MVKANVPKQFSAAGNGRFRDVGIGNLWKKEDLKEPNPPGEFTLEEPKTLGPTLTSTGWLKKSFCSKTSLKFTSSMERSTLNTEFTTGKATNKNADPSQ